MFMEPLIRVFFESIRLFGICQPMRVCHLCRYRRPKQPSLTFFSRPDTSPFLPYLYFLSKEAASFLFRDNAESSSYASVREGSNHLHYKRLLPCSRLPFHLLGSEQMPCNDGLSSTPPQAAITQVVSTSTLYQQRANSTTQQSFIQPLSNRHNVRPAVLDPQMRPRLLRQQLLQRLPQGRRDEDPLPLQQSRVVSRNPGQPAGGVQTARVSARHQQLALLHLQAVEQRDRCLPASRPARPGRPPSVCS